MRSILSAFLFLILVVVAQGQPGALQASFNPLDPGLGSGDGANGTIRAIAVQPDGRIWVGGDFTAFNGNTCRRLARLDAKGGLDPLFYGGGSGANASVNAITLRNNNLTLVGGTFTDYNGYWYRDYIVQLNQGRIDANFYTGDGASGHEGANGPVNALALQSNGKLLIGGDFIFYNSQPCNRLARLNTDGSLDLSFDPGSGANGSINALVLQGDGKIVIGGGFTSFNGVARNGIARLNADGSLDAAFNPGSGVNGVVNTLAIQVDGKVVLGGDFTTCNGATRNYIARLQIDGALDASFNNGTGANNTIYSLVLQTDGRILVGGAFTSFNSKAHNRIARLTGNGSLDATFNGGSGANSTVATLALQSDGKILAGGDFTTYNGTTRNRIARLNTDGTLDASFDPTRKINGKINTVVALYESGGTIMAGGDFTTYSGVACNYLACLTNDGGLYGGFNYLRSGPNAPVSAIASLNDTVMLIGGEFTAYNGTIRNHLASLNREGLPENTFNTGSGANGAVTAIVRQSDGKILIGGAFTTYNGTTRNRIARLNANGTLDASFDPGSGANGAINALALQPDGKIVIGGSFTAYNGTARNYLARLNSNGTLDASFNPGSGANSTVLSIGVQEGGKILVGGRFTAYNGTAINYLAQLKADGSLNAAFKLGSGVSGPVHSIALQSDGKILIGGAFNGYNGGASSIARLDADGSLDAGFDAGSGANGPIYATAFCVEGDIVVGGDFSSFNGVAVNKIALVGGGPYSIAVDSLPPLSYCAGSKLSIPFTAMGNYVPGNTFEAQLSSPSGRFDTDSVWWIGALDATTSGTITATLDSMLWEGSGYRVRVVSMWPAESSADSEARLAIHALPATPAVAGDTTFCKGSSMVLTATGAASYQWYRNGAAISGATAQNYSVSQAGQYAVSATSPYGCTSPLSALVAVSERPAPAKPVITQSGNILSSSAASGNQWFKNGTPISGATGQYFTAQASGLYTVEVEQDGCSVQSEPLNFAVTAISGPVPGMEAVSVYPVPVQDILYIANTGGRKLKVQLLDALGKTVQQSECTASPARLSLKGQARGTYLLLLTDVKKKETISRVIVKQ